MERLRRIDPDLPDICQTLTDKAIRFSQQYALTHNALGSARSVGYAVDASPVYGRQLLADARIQAAVAYYEAVYASKTMYSPDKVLAQLSTMASFNLLDCLDNDYELKPLDQLTEEQRAALGIALQGVDVKINKYGRTVSAHLAKMEALKELARFFKLTGTDEKETPEGLQLTINVGQQVTVDTEQGEAVGHLRISALPPERD